MGWYDFPNVKHGPICDFLASLAVIVAAKVTRGEALETNA